MLRAKFLATREQERFVSPDNWDFSIYSFDPKSFWYSKTNLPLSNDFEIVRYDFRGRVRFNAGLKKNGLQLGFIDSYSTVEARLQGMGKIDSILMITIGGHDWDGLSDIGALGIELNFSETLANRILGPEELFSIKSMGKLFGAGRSIVVKPSKAAIRLKQRAMRVLEQFDRETGIRFDDVNSVLDLSSINISEAIDDGIGFEHDALVEMSSNVIKQIMHDKIPDNRLGGQARRELALRVEALLWSPPSAHHALKDIGLDELSEILGVSRRSVQLAVQEQFGVGFVALKKIIRLYQIREQIIKRDSYKSITTLANEYYINHLGRFAREYKNFFGKLPSQDSHLPKGRTVRT